MHRIGQRRCRPLCPTPLINQPWFRDRSWNRHLVAWIAGLRVLGCACLPASFHPLCGSLKLSGIANPGGVRGVSWMEQIVRSAWMHRHLGSGSESFGRAASCRSRNWCFPRGPAGLRHVLVVALGDTGAPAYHASGGCLKVAGDYIPELGFFAILPGAYIGSDDYQDYYRMLLELDETGAHTLAISYCDTRGLEATFDDVLIPALRLAGQERIEGHISQENQRFIVEITRGLVKDLGNRFIKPRTTPRLRVLGICAPGEVHDLGLLLLLELLRHSGAAANFVDQGTPGGVRDFLKRYAPDMVCLSCTMPECLPAAAELVSGIKMDSPGLMVIGGGAAAVSSPVELLKAGCSQICASRGDARRVMRRFAVWRAESRNVGSIPGLNSPVNAPDAIASSAGNANRES